MEEHTSNSGTIVICLVIGVCWAQDKWVWSGKASKVSDGGRVRYGIVEPDNYQRPPELRPPPQEHRPLYPEHQPPPRDLPPLIRPQPPSNHPPLPSSWWLDRRTCSPFSSNIEETLQPPGHHETDPTSFPKCKCVHSFNCKSPGLLFGSCDSGKKYCCEKAVEGSEKKGFYPDDRQPEVLAGPGGPVDHIRQKKPDITGLGSYAERPYNRQSSGLAGGYRPQGPRY